jgi:Leucine-rich repeat (LRR) protein
LKLANNHIERIENLDGMNLTDLDLFGNEITVLDGLTLLPKLRKVELS